jgi:hypothetical protein
MSFREIAISIRAVNRASHEFERVRADADSLAVRMRSLGSAIAGLGATGSAIAHIAHQFGLLNDEQTRVITSLTYLITVVGMFVRTQMGAAVAHKIYAAACWIAKAAQDALNISYATFLALTGVGIAAIIAAAAAVSYFAGQMNSAADSVRNFNEAASEMPTRTRSITRAGEEELYRRGVESP